MILVTIWQICQIMYKINFHVQAHETHLHWRGYAMSHRARGKIPLYPSTPLSFSSRLPPILTARPQRVIREGSTRRSSSEYCRAECEDVAVANWRDDRSRESSRVTDACTWLGRAFPSMVLTRVYEERCASVTLFLPPSFCSSTWSVTVSTCKSTWNHVPLV